MKTTGADLIIKILEKIGVTQVAGIPGGSNLPIYNALANSKLKHILVRHEQSAGFIAQGITRISKIPAVCFATSGPGATNLLTSLADAYCDSIPVIAITGQVNTALIGSNAFQEIDICKMSGPVVKKAFQVHDAEELLNIIPEAFALAISGKPGPVLIDVPKDIQTQTIDIDLDNIFFESVKLNKNPQIDRYEQNLEYIINIINISDRPVLYIGGGVIRSDASYELRHFLADHQIPVVSTLMGLGAIEHDNPLFFGMLGMHGTISANTLLEQADLIISIGARFDDRATGNFSLFAKNSTLIHIDVEPLMEYKSRKIDFTWKSDAKSALKVLSSRLLFKSRIQWFEYISEIRKKNNISVHYIPEEVQNIITSVSEFIGSNDIITTDVGQHQMWVAQAFPFKHPGRFLTSGGLGTMGFGLPVSIGAALVSPSANVVCFSGDGSILMNIQELATLCELNLNVKIIIFNNRHLGLVHQQQHLFFDRKFIASKFESSPDLVQIFNGFGIPGSSITRELSKNSFLNEVYKMFSTPGPYLLDIEVSPDHMVFPMVPPGASNTEMIVSSTIID